MPRLHVLGIAAVLLGGCATSDESGTDWLASGAALLGGLAGGAEAPLAVQDIAAGLREALEVGSGRVVDRLGSAGGFNADPAVRIPLPQSLQRVRKSLAPLGLSGLLDDLETRLNRAAEEATPEARRLFVDAIRTMTLDDARRILDGPDDAATRYFQSRMAAPLATAWRPVVERSLADVGALRAYETALGEYARLPFVPDARADMGEYVIEKGLEGMFHYLAREEAAIRNDPLRRSTELLRRVFGR